MSEQNVCVYCNKNFTTKYILITHQKTSKSCKNNIEKITHNCEYCSKSFSAINNLNYHLNICDVKKDIDKKLQESIKIYQNQKLIEDEVKKYKQKSDEKFTEKINELEKKYVDEIQSLKISNKVLETRLEDTIKNSEERLEKKYVDEIQSLKISNKVLETRLEETIKNSEERLEEYRRQIDFLQNKGNTTTNHTHIHSDKTVIFNTYFTPEFLSEGMKDYDENLVCHGMPGLAAYVKEKFLKKDGKLIYTCTDIARQHFKFIYDGKEINDKTASMLVKSLKPALTKQLKYINTQLNTTEDKLESIPKSDRTEEEKTKLDVTKHIITNKLTPLTIDIRELETNHKLSLELSRLV